MTIQPNILIWTILCFCAFMLILWRLLLKPLLGFMDARDARIARARSLDRSGEKAAKAALREQERLEALRRQGRNGRRPPKPCGSRPRRSRTPWPWSTSGS